MSGAKTGSAFLIAILAAIVLPCAGIAQMQQTGTQDSTSTNSSRTEATATSTAGLTGFSPRRTCATACSMSVCSRAPAG